MRVLRTGVGDGRLVDLHPAVSLVTGLTTPQRAALRDAVAAIGTGLAPDRPGLLEAHGILLDATQDDLDLLDAGATAVRGVISLVDIDGALPPGDGERLGAADRAVLVGAQERWAAVTALRAAAEAAPGAGDLPPAARATQLRARIRRHDALDPAPVLVALDAVRDGARTGAPVDHEPLGAALAGVGLDVRDLGLPVEEVARLAEDWADERRREGEWATGALVELQALDGARSATDAPSHADDLRAAVQRAAGAQAEAARHADGLRAELTEQHAPQPSADAVEWHVLARLPAHRPVRPAGAVPLLLDGLLGHLDAAAVAHVLDRLTGLAGTVQLVVVDDHPAAAAWVDAAGRRRAALVTPTETATVPAS